MITKLTRQQHQDDRHTLEAFLAAHRAEATEARAHAEATEARGRRVDDAGITWIG